ncbi:MAG: helix-turn-helix domain-containing protein [Patescibacteria group bacterium]
MLENLLQTCGLNATEQAVFLHLFERGESIASVLAKQLHLKRTTVYAALDTLVHLGIVARKKRGSVTYFSCLAPDMTAKILEAHAREQFEDVQSATQLLQTHLKQLLPKTQDFGAFEISTFESMEAVYLQLEETLLSGDFTSFFNPQLAIKTERYKNLVKNFLKSTSNTKVQIREILVAGPMTDWYKSHVNNPNHQIKEMESSALFFSDVILVNDYVIFNSYDPKNEVGIKIREKHLHQSLLTLFNWMWDRI